MRIYELFYRENSYDVNLAVLSKGATNSCAYMLALVCFVGCYRVGVGITLKVLLLVSTVDVGWGQTCAHLYGVPYKSKFGDIRKLSWKIFRNQLIVQKHIARTADRSTQQRRISMKSWLFMRFKEAHIPLWSIDAWLRTHKNTLIWNIALNAWCENGMHSMSHMLFSTSSVVLWWNEKLISCWRRKSIIWQDRTEEKVFLICLMVGDVLTHKPTRNQSLFNSQFRNVLNV